MTEMTIIKALRTMEFSSVGVREESSSIQTACVQIQYDSLSWFYKVALSLIKRYRDTE